MPKTALTTHMHMKQTRHAYIHKKETFLHSFPQKTLGADKHSDSSDVIFVFIGSTQCGSRSLRPGMFPRPPGNPPCVDGLCMSDISRPLTPVAVLIQEIQR